MVFGLVSDLIGSQAATPAWDLGAQRTLTAPELPGLYLVTVTIYRRLATC